MMNRHHIRGFTLFEMLIAVSIFAFMGVIAFGGLSQMTRAGQAVVDANNGGKTGHAAINQLNPPGAQLDIVDRAYILHDGTVLMEGPPSEIVAHKDVRRVYLGERFSL